MKNYNKIIIATFAIALAICSCKSKYYTVTILHTNDTHSQIECYTDSTGTNGGSLRRYQAICDIRKSEPNVFLLDAGDFVQGTPYFNLFGGDAEVELMNLMGYDAATLGNHEFDNGLDTLALMLGKARFPVVCANYRFSHPVLDTLVKPYVILNRNGLKIGVFGLTANLDGLTFAYTYSKLTYMDPVEVSKNMVKTLNDKGCDLIVCLSHLGYDPEPGRPMCDPILASQVNGIDLIVSGHTHIEVDTVVNNTHIIQTGVRGVKLGHVTIKKRKRK